MAQAGAASRDVGTGGTSLRVKVRRFGGFLSGIVMPNIGAFMAWVNLVIEQADTDASQALRTPQTGGPGGEP